MDTNLLLVFLNEQYYVFGICPCCGDIFQLSDCVITTQHKNIELPELDNVIKLQNENNDLMDKFYNLQNKLEANESEKQFLKYKLMDLRNNPEIIKRKIEGRKDALRKSKRLQSLFHKTNFDPRDARLIFSPIEWVVFDGLTENKESEKVVFLSKKPDSVSKEKINKSLQQSIKKGNIDFQTIRITEKGHVVYE